MPSRSGRRFRPSGGVLSIDPGSSSGAIAYVLGQHAEAWPLANMTEQEVFLRIADVAKSARCAVLERVNAMPRGGKFRVGTASMFKFGASFGALRMALVAVGINYTLVVPSVWQGKLNCRTGGDKRITRDLAQRMFPKLRITHKIADAILLGHYGEKFV